MLLSDRWREFGVITLEDCLAMCGLTEDEVLAIAEHEHIPEIAAAGLGDYLLTCEHGAARICDMILDDIQNAHGRGDLRHAQDLAMVLRHFLGCHPEAQAAVTERQTRLAAASARHKTP